MQECLRRRLLPVEAGRRLGGGAVVGCVLLLIPWSGWEVLSKIACRWSNSDAKVLDGGKSNVADQGTMQWNNGAISIAMEAILIAMRLKVAL